jgi:predicted acylesterase/phospholipase RssA
VIGTSIGAINGAIIAGNPPERRLDRLREFWHRMERNSFTAFHHAARGRQRDYGGAGHTGVL